MAGYPNVPNAPGVPPLLRDPFASAATAVKRLTRDILVFLGLADNRWGIFLNGKPVVLADSVISFGYKQGWTLSDYPLEEGAFETYDKVNTPFEARLRFVAGGSETDRQRFLESIDAISGTLTLFDVVTPERVYHSVNVERYDYHRASNNGVGLIAVDINLLQIRVTATATFTQTQQPQSADAVNDGTVQTTPPTPSQSALSGLFH